MKNHGPKTQNRKNDQKTRNPWILRVLTPFGPLFDPFLSGYLTTIWGIGQKGHGEGLNILVGVRKGQKVLKKGSKNSDFRGYP